MFTFPLKKILLLRLSPREANRDTQVLSAGGHLAEFPGAPEGCGSGVGSLRPAHKPALCPEGGRTLKPEKPSAEEARGKGVPCTADAAEAWEMLPAVTGVS